LTDRQRCILDYLIQYARRHGMPPTRREMAAHFEISINGVTAHLGCLQLKGFILVTALSARAITILPDRLCQTIYDPMPMEIGQ
jgi:repressor LexA